MSEFKSFTQGLFEILLPGSFLLLNVVAFLCIAAGVSPDSQMMLGADKWGIVEAIPVLGASYILGMVLRMLRTEIPDRISAWWIRCVPPRMPDKEDYLKECFFYPKWMGERYVPSLPPAAMEFFNELWSKHCQEPGPGSRNPNTQFFNFIKTLLLAINKETYGQLMASEAVSRFVASSFWALVICTGLLLVDGCLLLARGFDTAFYFCVLLFLLYSAVLYGIVRNFRFLRCKEVAFVFDASFAHREEIMNAWKQSTTSASDSSTLNFTKVLRTTWKRKEFEGPPSSGFCHLQSSIFVSRQTGSLSFFR